MPLCAPKIAGHFKGKLNKDEIPFSHWRFCSLHRKNQCPLSLDELWPFAPHPAFRTGQVSLQRNAGGRAPLKPCWCSRTPLAAPAPWWDWWMRVSGKGSFLQADMGTHQLSCRHRATLPTGDLQDPASTPIPLGIIICWKCHLAVPFRE